MVKSKVKLSTPDFDYDREQWFKIEQCICAVRSGGLSEKGRARLRKAAIQYLSDKRAREGGNYVSPGRAALSWKNMSRICDELRDKLENALEYRYGADWHY